MPSLRPVYLLYSVYHDAMPVHEILTLLYTMKRSQSFALNKDFPDGISIGGVRPVVNCFMNRQNCDSETTRSVARAVLH